MENLYIDEEKVKAKKGLKRIYTFIFLFTTFSGAIRKWGIDSSIINNVVLAIQLCISFSFLFLLRLKGIKSPFKPLLTAYVLLLIVLAANPMNYTIFHALFGFILHLGLWIALFFYFENRDLFDLKDVFGFFIIVSLAEIILGFVQYSLPPTHLLNKYVNETSLTDIALVGNSVRVTGTFSYLAGYASFFVFFSLFLWALARRGYSSTRIIFFYSLGMIGCFMSGSRSAFYPYLLIGILMLYTEYGIKRFFGALGSFAAIALTAVILNFFLGERISFLSNTINKSYENFENRRSVNKKRGEESGRIMKTLDGVIFFPGDYPEIGVGLGATYQGAIAIWGTSPYVSSYPGWLEEEPERIIVEGGFVLFFFRIFLFMYLFRNLRMPPIPKAILLIFSFVFLSLVFFTYTATYFLLGLIILDSSYKGKNKLQLTNKPSQKNQVPALAN
jgi:hypothetical protein